MTPLPLSLYKTLLYVEARVNPPFIIPTLIHPSDSLSMRIEAGPVICRPTIFFTTLIHTVSYPTGRGRWHAPSSRHLRALLSVCGGCSFGGVGCCSCRVCVCVCVCVSVSGVLFSVGVCVCVCDLLICSHRVFTASQPCEPNLDPLKLSRLSSLQLIFTSCLHSVASG